MEAVGFASDLQYWRFRSDWPTHEYPPIGERLSESPILTEYPILDDPLLSRFPLSIEDVSSF